MAPVRDVVIGAQTYRETPLALVVLVVDTHFLLQHLQFLQLPDR